MGLMAIKTLSQAFFFLLILILLLAPIPVKPFRTTCVASESAPRLEPGWDCDAMDFESGFSFL